MAIYSKGMDPAAVRSAGERFRTFQQETEQIRTRSRHAIDDAKAAWGGPDLDRLAASWPAAEQSLREAGTSLKALGDKLIANVTDQLKASESSGGSGLPPGAAGGGTPVGAPKDQTDGNGNLDPQIQQKWNSMSDAEKRRVLDNMAKDLAKRYGIPAPNFRLEPIQSDPGYVTYGYWDEQNKTMVLNSDFMNDPSQMMTTLAHEMRHAYQYQVARDIQKSDDTSGIWKWLFGDPYNHPDVPKDQARAWAQNWDDYKSTDNGDTFQQYHDQPVEVDARVNGKKYVDELTPEQFDSMR